MSGKHGLDLIAPFEADNPLDRLPADEQDQSRETPHLEHFRYTRIGVNIDLAYAQAGFVFPRKFGHDRLKHLARRAPLSRKIQQDGQRRADDLFLEILIRDCKRIVSHDNPSSISMYDVLYQLK
jgi:hypothetical protein